MANKTYSLVNSVILNGRLFVAGSDISLTDKEAENLKQSIKGGHSISEQDNSEQKETQSNNDVQEVMDYEDMTKAQLKELTEELELDVNPTGSKGSYVKADYIKALNE